jgi:S-formylglutathione hydrolase FrmB
MGLIHFNHFSQPLEKACAMFVALPERADGPVPVVYLLHGLSDDYTIWQRRTSIERYADRHQVMVVMPDGARSFYVDAGGTARYEQHLLETVALVDRTFRTIAGPHGRGIGGLSMGGYGAMKLGLKHPQLFGSVVSHSGVLDIAARRRERPDELGAILGARVARSEDCFALAARPGPKPAIAFDCGVDDFLIGHSRRFHAHLAELGIAHRYREFPGAHTWEYWDAHVDAGLRFHLACFARSRKADGRRARQPD